jgi:hypothetical protein
MRGDSGSLDVVARGADDGVSLTLAASQILDNQLLLAGGLIDPTFAAPVQVQMRVNASPELAGGAHVERATDLVVTSGSDEARISWLVESIDLRDGYILHDARVLGDEGPIRAFAIEDLVWFVGVGLAAAVTGLIAWRSHKRDEQSRADADRKWTECIERGGTPTIEYLVAEEASLGKDGRPRIGASYSVRVRCEQQQSSPAQQSPR